MEKFWISRKFLRRSQHDTIKKKSVVEDGTRIELKIWQTIFPGLSAVNQMVRSVV